VSFNQLKLLVLQPTSFCNLNCRYCYVPNRSAKGVMALEVLEAVIKKVFAEKHYGQLEILYHAGEPTSVGIDFYQNSVDLVKKYNNQNIPVVHMIQTNATLLNKEWCDFFQEYDFKVGVSLDGPEYLHNLNRKNWAGLGSYTKTLRGLKMLQEAGLNPGVLTVITSKHLSFPNELIDFYIENKIKDVGFNFEEIENDNYTSSLGNKDQLPKKALQDFMIQVYNLVIGHHEKLKIREFSDTISKLSSLRNNPNYQSEPVETRDLEVLTVQKEGQISTYCPEFAGVLSVKYNNFVLSNIFEINKLSELWRNTTFVSIKRDFDTRKNQCKRECKYYKICGSSYLSNGYSEHQSLLKTENATCIVRKKIMAKTILTQMKNSIPAHVRTDN